MRERAAEAVNSERRFQVLVEAVTDYAIYLLDPDGLITSWNSGAERLKGYTEAEVLGRSHAIFFTPEERAAGEPARALQTARARGRFEIEGWRLRKGGHRFWGHVVVEAIRDEAGEVHAFAHITQDISSRRSLEERFRKVVESAPNAMVMVNQAGLIELINTQTERLFGYHRSELLGQPVERLVPMRLSKGHPALREAFYRDPRARPMGAGRDLFALRRDGSEFPVEIGLNPIETEEGTMVLAAIVDISDRKHKEERIHAALREKDVLLGEIHHRVKNNLQIINSLLDLQSAKIDDPRVLEMLRESQNRIKSMALIHQTLYESKDFAEVDFSRFLDTLVPTLVSSYAMQGAPVELAVDAISVLLPINLAIPCGLIVNELISNALKHAFPNGRPGTITVSLAAEPDSRVKLSVCDNGIGLPENLDLAATTTLGLQLVTLLADQVGSELDVTPRNPTCFVLRFPVQH